MAVQRPTSNFRRFTVGCLFHVDFEAEKWVGVHVNHAQIRPRARQTFKPRNRVGGGGIEDLPLKHRTGINSGVHVQQTVSQGFTSAKQGWAKHVGCPVSLAVSRTTAGRDDNVVHPRRVRTGIDAPVLDVFPGEGLSRGWDGESLLTVAHGSRPPITVATVA